MQSAFGITPRLDDGSGLSRYDSTTPSQVVTAAGDSSPTTQAFVNSLAVAGETGTLQDRDQGTPGQGQLPRQDRARCTTSRTWSATAGARRRHARFRVPGQRSGRPRLRARDRGATWPSRWPSTTAETWPQASSSRSPASSSTGTPSRSACASFEPGALAGDDVSGLARHRAGDPAAGGDDHLASPARGSARAACR